MMEKNKLARSWKVLTKCERDELRWVTILFGGIRVSEEDARSRERALEIAAQTQAMVNDFCEEWTSLMRGRHLPGTIWRGAHELELHRDVGVGDHSYDFLEGCGCDMTPLAKTERYLVPHVHFVIALGKTSPVSFKEALARWDAPRQVMIKQLWKKQTVVEAVTNLSLYTHKNKLQYKTGGFDDVPVKFTDDYGIVWGRFINIIYKDTKREFRNSD